MLLKLRFCTEFKVVFSCFLGLLAQEAGQAITVAPKAPWVFSIQNLEKGRIASLSHYLNSKAWWSKMHCLLLV